MKYAKSQVKKWKSKFTNYVFLTDRSVAMEKIVVISSQKGCGKTTIATNLAAIHSKEGYEVTLVDYTKKEDALHWSEKRSEQLSPVSVVAAYNTRSSMMTKEWMQQVGSIGKLENHNKVIMDANNDELIGQRRADVINRADIIIVPVAPALGGLTEFSDFLSELITSARRNKSRLMVVANMLEADQLMLLFVRQVLNKFKIPVIAKISTLVGYSKALATGKSICEIERIDALEECVSWKKLIDGIHSDNVRVDSVAGTKLGRGLSKATESSVAIAEASRNALIVTKELLTVTHAEKQTAPTNNLRHKKISELKKRNMLLKAHLHRDTSVDV